MAASLCMVCFSKCSITARKTGSLLLRNADRIRWSQPANLRGYSKGSPGLQARVRTLPLLIGGGSSYYGYKQYEHYKDRKLEKLGIEVPPRLANELQASYLQHGFVDRHTL